MPRLGGIHAKFIIWRTPDKLFNIIQDEKRNEDNNVGEEPRSPERVRYVEGSWGKTTNVGEVDSRTSERP